MKIKTEFNTGDKVWFYIEELNKYAWGEVLSMDISVRCGRVDVIDYNIENRFYNPKLWYGVVSDYKDFRLSPIITFKEEETFKDFEDVKDFVSMRYQKQLDSMQELKKGFWGIK